MMKFHMTIYLYYQNGELTFHECIIFGHPGGYHGVFAKAIDFWQLSDSFLTLVSAMKPKNNAVKN